MNTVIISNVFAVPAALISNEIYAKLLPLIVHEDPSWVIKRAKGYFADPKDRYIYSYSMTPDGQYYLFNRGLMGKVADVLNESGVTYEIEDRRVMGEPLNILPHWGSSLFKFQERAIGDVVQGEDGLLVAECGSGKTVMGAALITSLKLPTLVVVTSLDILKQWIDSIHKFTDYKKHKIGVIGGGKCKIAPITITTFQSLAKFTKEEWTDINAKFGCLIMDECFHPDTKILLPNNKYLPIHKIVDDALIDSVMSFDESKNALVEKKILRRIKTPIRDRAIYDVTIRASNGVERVITCTDNHKFWTANRGYVQAKDLLSSDTLKLLTDDYCLTHVCKKCKKQFNTKQQLRSHSAHHSTKYALGWSDHFAKCMKTRSANDSYRAGISRRMTSNNPMHNSVIVDKMKKSCRRFYNLNPEKLLQRKKNFMNAPLRGRDSINSGMTKPEQFIDSLSLPGVKYTGRGDFWVTFKSGKHKNPDFIIEGERKVIETGDTHYWHNADEIASTIAEYKKIGYDCVFISCDDIAKDPSAVELRLKKFIFNHDAAVISVRKRKQPPKFVYNLEIEDTHNYFANGALVSNCHHSPCASMMAITNKSKAKYRFGFTATPTRKDKKEFVMFDCLGHRTIVIPSEDLAAEGRRVIPSIEFVPMQTGLSMPTMLRWDGTKRIQDSNWSKFFTDISECTPRNERIVDTVEAKVAAGHICLVLSNRVEHCNTIYHMLSLRGIKCGLILGTMNAADRATTTKKAKAGELDVVVATNNLAAEGLDIPVLSCVHVLMPTSNTPFLKQAIGRVCRATDGKTALAVDYVDMDCDILYNMHLSRAKFYRSENYVMLNDLKKR
jgi:superfamily II DNA or RNA helicase